MLRLKKTACLLLLPTMLGGCGMELPFVGNVQEKVLPLLDTIENTLTPLKGVIGPLRERFFPQEKSDQEAQPGPRRHRTHAAAADQGNEDEEEAQPEATPSPTPDPRQKRLENNMAFDHWRSEGIRKIYEGQTLEAITCFKKALALRPNDPNIQDWLFLVENRSSRGKKAIPMPAPMRDIPAPAAQPAAPGPAAPALPAGPNLF